MAKKNLQQIKKLLLDNPELVHHLSKESLSHFMLFCLSDMFKYRLGIFHMHMMLDAGMGSKNIVCPIHPDSYADQIFMYSYILWSIFGVNKYSNCVIVCGTRDKGREVYTKFKDELINNVELKKFDHKVTEECCDGWNIFIPGYNARISITTFPMRPSRFRHKRRRPDVVICNELEDSRAGSQTITQWMETELYGEDCFYDKTIVFGTVRESRNDCLFDAIRLRGVEHTWQQPFDVSITPCPLFNDEKECLWDQRYSEKEIKNMLKNWNDEKWQRKNLLHTIEVIKMPKRCINEDGTCNAEEYLKHLQEKGRKELESDSPYAHALFERVHFEVALDRQAYEYSILGGYYKYYGTGVVLKFEPEDE